jgi:hypothetical protein
MVTRQFMANQSAHVERREDFLLLQERGQTKPSERLYQMLIQELPGLSDRSLAEDLARTALVVDPRTPDKNSLIWKYHASVMHELQQRSERRLSRTLDEAAK